MNANLTATRLVEVLVCCEVAADLHWHQAYYLCGECKVRSIYSQCGAVSKCQECGCFYHFACRRPGDRRCQKCGEDNAVDISLFVQQIGLEWITTFEAITPQQEEPPADNTNIQQENNNTTNNITTPSKASSNGVSSSEDNNRMEISQTDDSMSQIMNQRLSLDEAEEQQHQPFAATTIAAETIASQPHSRVTRIRAGKTVSTPNKKAVPSKREVDDDDYLMQEEPKHKSPKVKLEQYVNYSSRQTQSNGQTRGPISPPVRNSLKEEKMETYDLYDDDEDDVDYKYPSEGDSYPSPSAAKLQGTLTQEDLRLNLCSVKFSDPAVIVMDDIDDFEPTSNRELYPTEPKFDISSREIEFSDKVLDVPGPDPRRGNIPLKKVQIHEVEEQGTLVSGDVTSAYLGLLSKSYWTTTKVPDGYSKFVFKATGDFVWTSLKRSQDEMKSWKHVWMALAKSRSRRKPHYNLIDDREAVTALQIFEGCAEAGHFACLIIDRRMYPAGIFTFFDSGKRFSYTSMRTMKECFEESGCAASEESIWIDADVPQQGSKTMDCGIWMCMFIARFLRALKEKDGTPVPGGLLLYRNVTMRLSATALKDEASWFKVDGPIDATMAGWFGRAHVRESLFRGEIHENPRALSMLECEIDE